ncbi:TIGR04104 family putative zinc finger protein [Peribacillus butanolivorans]|uniref:TIGR04104 family putative zinc finger protein n=1 Tax=Peribacillus butanolivorans TaxID=421767 RepID=UPI00366C598F
MLRFSKERGVFFGIQKCETCGYQFTWKEIQKAIRWTYKPLVCKKCGTKHNVTKQTRLLLVLSAGAIVGFLLFIVIDISFVLLLLLSILLPLIVILLYPYFAKYKATS